MLQEIHYAWRKLLKTPGFTALTLFVLAAGLGVAIYMFSLIKTLAFADMPFPDQERIIAADIVEDGFEQNGGNVNWYDYQQFAAQAQSFESLVPDKQGTVIYSGNGLPRRLSGSYTLAAQFDLTQVQPLLGRRLMPEDEKSSNANVAVLSYMLWQRDFAADKDVIGKVVKFDDKTTTIVGVMPQGYSFPQVSEVWLPLRDPGVKQPGEAPQVLLLGKLKAGVSLDQADSELRSIAKQIAEQFPSTNGKRSIRVWPLTRITMTNAMPLIALMMGAASLIMLLVILNAGNLLLVRAIGRQKEVAIRASLGAPRFTLIREFLTEALLLTLIAALIACFAASWAGDWSQRQFAAMSDSIPFWWNFAITGKTLIFAFVLAVFTALAIGVYPAFRTSRGDLTSYLRDGTRGAQGMRVMRMTNILVVAEIVLAIALLIASGVLISSIAASLKVDYGVATDHRLIARMALYKDSYKENAAQLRFFEEVIASAKRSDGITDATISAAMPGDYSSLKSYLKEGMSITDRQYPTAPVIATADNFLTFFKTPLVEGRYFDSRDREDSFKAVVLSQQLAEKLWPGVSAVGKRIKLDPENEKSEWLLVIGVAGNILHGQPVGNYHTENIYLSYRQFPERWMGVAIQTSAAPLASVNALAQAVANVDQDMPVYRAYDFQAYLKSRTGGISFVGSLFVTLAGLAVVLAGSGIYAVIARSVQLRTQEIGVRRALGADDRSMMGLLLRQGLKRLLVGAVIGVALGMPLVSLVGSLTVNSTATTIIVSLIVLALVSAIVMLATFVPSRQAIALSPAIALHYE